MSITDAATMRSPLPAFVPLALAIGVALAACGGGDANVADVANDGAPQKLEKSAKYTVGGSITGLPQGGGVTLTLDFVTLDTFTADGAFTLTPALGKGASYSVGVAAPPDGYTCTVTNGAGIIGKASVTNVAVSCAPLPKVRLQYQVSGLPAGQSVTLNALGFSVGTATANGTYAIGEVIAPAIVNFGITTQTPGAGCSVPASDQVVFVTQDTPSPLTLHVNCGALPG